MKIDIEKLNRKTPYPEPSEAFFKTIQDQVIAKTVGEKVVVKEETKVFALNFKWAAAAAVVLIAGITAFFGLNDSSDVQLAQQKPMVDSVYEISQPSKSIVDQTPEKALEIQIPERRGEYLKAQQSAAYSSKTQDKKTVYDNTDRQAYAVESAKKPEAEVEKVLAAFTPDQLKDLEKNSEQDVYLDLYN